VYKLNPSPGRKVPIVPFTTFSDDKETRYVTDNFGAGVNPRQSTMRDFSAAAVVTAYLQVSVIAGEQGLGLKLNTVFTSIATGMNDFAQTEVTHVDFKLMHVRRPATRPPGNGRPAARPAPRSSTMMIVFFRSISNRRYNMSQIRTHDAVSIRDRYQTFFDSAFMPNIRHEQMPGADERVAYAAEYAARQLGQIDEKLGRLIEIMEQRAAQSS
jgi:hypothetical protein